MDEFEYTCLVVNIEHAFGDFEAERVLSGYYLDTVSELNIAASTCDSIRLLCEVAKHNPENFKALYARIGADVDLNITN